MICEAYAQKKGYFIHRGKGRPDAHRAARAILKEAVEGQLVFFLLPFLIVPLVLRPIGWSWAICLCVAGLVSALGVRAVARTRTPRNVARDMLDVAASVGSVVDCPLVLMGHSHHGSLEHGSPVVPATREATLVHMIDNLGGRLGSFDRLERELAPGSSWSGFDRAIGSGAWFGPGGGEARRSAA